MPYFDHDFRRFPELTNSQLEQFGFVSPHVQIDFDFQAVVVAVHDGDTITVRTDFRDFDFPIRLSGIDAPELSEGGDAARDWLSGVLLGESVQVFLDVNNRVGKYGRLIGIVVYNGMDVAEEMFYLGLVSRFGFKNDGVVPSLDVFFREVLV